MTDDKHDHAEISEEMAVAADQVDKEIPDIPSELAILPVRNTVLYPSMVLPLMVARGRSVKLVDSVLMGSRLLGVVAQRDPATEEPDEKELYRYGSVGTILKMLKFPDESIRVLVRGIRRIRIKDIKNREHIKLIGILKIFQVVFI